MFNKILDLAGSIWMWKGYKKCLTPEVLQEVRRIQEKAGCRERVTDKEVAWLESMVEAIRSEE